MPPWLPKWRRPHAELHPAVDVLIAGHGPRDHHFLNQELGAWLDRTWKIETGLDRGTMVSPNRQITRAIRTTFISEFGTQLGCDTRAERPREITIERWPLRPQYACAG